MLSGSRWLEAALRTHGATASAGLQSTISHECAKKTTHFETPSDVARIALDAPDAFKKPMPSGPPGKRVFGVTGTSSILDSPSREIRSESG